MRYQISKEFHFSASHVLKGLPENHPCSRLHGHNYVVEVVLEGDRLDDVGFVRDYRALAPVKSFLDNSLDHRHLNDLVDFNPTAENLARWLFDSFKPILPELVAVRVSETPKTWATFGRAS